MIVENFNDDEVIAAIRDRGPIARSTLTPREQAIFTMAFRNGAIDFVKIAGRWTFILRKRGTR